MLSGFDMARNHAPQISEFPFHVTGRRHNKSPFDLDLELVWQIMSDHLYLTHIFFGLKIHAFVLMPNHFHLLCSTDTESLGVAFNYFMRETSKLMNQYSGNTNQNWGSRYYRCEIASDSYFMSSYKYVYQNPVRSKLVTKCENWRYSTLHALVGRAHTMIPVANDTLLFTESGLLLHENLTWLNQKPTEQNILAVKKALRKRKFKLPKDESRRPHYLEDGRL